MQGIEGVPNYHLSGENRSGAILVAVSVGSRGAEAHLGLMVEKSAFMRLGWIAPARYAGHERRNHTGGAKLLHVTTNSVDV